MPDELVSPLNEVLHVGRICVTAVVLTPSKLSVEETVVDCLEYSGVICWQRF
jgi:hypothetical protein